MYKEITFQSQSMVLVIAEHAAGAFLACVSSVASAQWLQKIYESALTLNDMWWLSDEQVLPYVDDTRIMESDLEVLLAKLDGGLVQRALLGRQFFWPLGSQELISHRAHLPNIITPSSEFERKTTLLRYFNVNTNLHSGMKLNDVFDETQASDTVLLGYARAARLRGEKSVQLTSPKLEGDVRPLMRILQKRRSLKKYSNTPISFDTLSTLLAASAGVSKPVKDKQGNELAFYTYPVGGGIKSTHLYFYANHVDSLSPGFYYFNPTTNAAEPVSSEISLEQLAKGTAYFDAIAHCSVLCFVVADYYAKSLKYLDRAYRIVLSESGHLSQNVHLVATGLGLKSCVLMGFDDVLYAKAIGLDGNEQCVVSLLTVGL